MQLTFSLPGGIAPFMTARSLAKAAQAAIGNGVTPLPVSADGSSLLGPDGNPITCTVQNFGVLDSNGQPTPFTFNCAPQGYEPSSPDPANTMTILAGNTDEVAMALADYYFSEGQTAGTGVQAANNGGANVEDMNYTEYAVAFIADPS